MLATRFAPSSSEELLLIARLVNPDPCWKARCVWSGGRWLFRGSFYAREEARHIFPVALDPTLSLSHLVPSSGVTSSAWTKINDGVTRLGLSRPFFSDRVTGSESKKRSRTALAFSAT